jgi:hypothetical protein
VIRSDSLIAGLGSLEQFDIAGQARADELERRRSGLGRSGIPPKVAMSHA